MSFHRNDENNIVYDMTPNPNELKIGTHVIAHWSGVAAFLAATITKIEGNKYHVLYDDGDKGVNRIEQMRILKPPLFFGKLLFTMNAVPHPLVFTRVYSISKRMVW